MRPAPLALAASLLCCASWSSPALAEPNAPAGGGSGEEPAEIDPDEGIARPPAPDFRTSHWLFSAGGVVMAPSPNFVPTSGTFGSFTYGGGVRGALGFGLSRHTLLRLDGGAGWLDGAAGCADCSSLSADVGLSLAYLLAQGVAFDPWAAFGVGYRYSDSDFVADSATSHAIDVARLSLGGDFFPVPSFGFGPFIETDIGVVAEPEVNGYAVFLAGMRFTFDPLRIGAEASSEIAAR